MEKTGEVTAVHGDWLEITFCRPSDCEKCHACGDGPKKATIKVKGKANLGDTAVVSLPTQTVLKASSSPFMWKWTVEGDFSPTAAPISRTEGG